MSLIACKEGDICPRCNNDVIKLFENGNVACGTCGFLLYKKYEEGDQCPVCNKGEFLFEPDGDCACHINPPCSACENSYLECNTCGTKPEEIEEIEITTDDLRGYEYSETEEYDKEKKKVVNYNFSSDLNENVNVVDKTVDNCWLNWYAMKRDC